MHTGVLFLSVGLLLHGCALGRTPEYHVKVAGNYYQRGDYHKAIEECRKALARYPLHKEAHYNIGNAYVKLAQYDRAIKAFKQAIWIQETYPEPHYGLAVVYARQRELEKASKELRRYLELVPTDRRAVELLQKIEDE